MPRLALVALCAFVLTACPVLASDPSARSAAVPCGWDTNEILSELGYSATEIETFLTKKTVYTH